MRAAGTSGSKAPTNKAGRTPRHFRGKRTQTRSLRRYMLVILSCCICMVGISHSSPFNPDCRAGSLLCHCCTALVIYSTDESTWQLSWSTTVSKGKSTWKSIVLRAHPIHPLGCISFTSCFIGEVPSHTPPTSLLTVSPGSLSLSTVHTSPYQLIPLHSVTITSAEHALSSLAANDTTQRSLLRLVHR